MDGMENGLSGHMTITAAKSEVMKMKKAKYLSNRKGWCTMAGIGKEEGLCTKALELGKRTARQ